MRSEDRGQLDRRVTISRYHVTRNEFGESVSTLDWRRETWARHRDTEAELLIDDGGVSTTYSARYILRYRDDIDLTLAHKTYYINEPGGEEQLITAAREIGRRRYIEVAI